MQKRKKVTKLKSGRGEFAKRFKEIASIDGKSKNNTKELRNTGKEKVGFDSRLRKRTTVSNAEVIFEDINSAFDESTMAKKIIPMISDARNTGI